MSTRQLTATIVGCLAFAAISFSTAPVEAKISAIKGKRYTLDKRHGPWMIMVTNFHANDEDGRKRAAATADELVYELRKRGLPAYVYKQEGKLQKFEGVDPLGRKLTGAYAAQRNQIAIMAGNYESIDESTKDGRIAQRTLEWVKNFQPKLPEYARFRKTPGKPNPFSRAMLVPNPLLSTEELQARKDIKQLALLNKGIDYSLTQNPGKFTLVVATFHGATISLQDSEAHDESQRNRKFEEALSRSQSLDKAAERAHQLVQLLRNHQQQYDAYVWHDRYQSYVTVGSFNDPHDPRVRQLYELFRAKKKEHNGQTHLVAEYVTSAVDPKNPNAKPELEFIMDPEPKLMTVPEN